MTTKTLDYLQRVIARRIETARGKIDTWTAKLADDPVYAMEWSDEMHLSVWEGRIYHEILNILEGPHPVTGLANYKEMLTREALRSAKYPCRSTSCASRESHIAKGEVMAKFIEDWDFMFDELEE